MKNDDDDRQYFWWMNGPNIAIGLMAGLIVVLAIIWVKDTYLHLESHDTSPLTTQQACARLLADIDMLHGEGARKDAATIRRVCAEMRAADADAVGMAITTGGT